MSTKTFQERKKLCRWSQRVDPLACFCYSIAVMFRLRPVQPADFLCCTACEDLLEVSFVTRHRPHLTDIGKAPMSGMERVRSRKKILFSFFSLVNILYGDQIIEQISDSCVLSRRILSLPTSSNVADLNTLVVDSFMSSTSLRCKLLFSARTVASLTFCRLVKFN